MNNQDNCNCNYNNCSCNHANPCHEETCRCCCSVKCPPGPPGPRGPQGPQGPAGATGAVGPRGPQGPAGETGPAGPQGAAGETGPVGPRGAVGETGPVGPQGPAGVAGPAGPQGATGETGPVGPQGPVGATGPVGPQGPVGATGPIGPQGPVGATGPVGPPGPVGATGPVGPRGPAGESGPAGGVLSYANFYALMPPDNADTVDPGETVDFPRNGPISGNDIIRIGADSFKLACPGTYHVIYHVSITEPGQLVLALNGEELEHTLAGRDTETSQIVGMTLVRTTCADSVLTLRNPSGCGGSLTVTPRAGGDRTVSAHLVIIRLE